MLIKTNVLPADAIVSNKSLAPGNNALISIANSKIGNNQFIKILQNQNTYKLIKAFDRNLNNISSLVNNAQIYISFKDDGNGQIGNIDETKLKMFGLDQQKHEWTIINNSTVDVMNKQVTGLYNNFTIFCLMGYYESSDFNGSFLTYPNPANINNIRLVLNSICQKQQM